MFKQLAVVFSDCGCSGVVVVRSARHGTRPRGRLEGGSEDRGGDQGKAEPHRTAGDPDADASLRSGETDHTAVEDQAPAYRHEGAACGGESGENAIAKRLGSVRPAASGKDECARPHVRGKGDPHAHLEAAHETDGTGKTQRMTAESRHRARDRPRLNSDLRESARPRTGKRKWIPGRGSNTSNGVLKRLCEPPGLPARALTMPGGRRLFISRRNPVLLFSENPQLLSRIRSVSV